MHIIAWNIQNAGKERSPKVAKALLAKDPDIIILTEYQPHAAPLIKQLRASGYKYDVRPEPPPRIGGVAIVSKRPIEEQPLPLNLEPFRTRYLPVRLIDDDLEIRGIYGLLETEPHDDFWKATLDVLESEADRSVLVAGDFNTCESLVDTPVPDFFCSQYFNELPKRGYTDLWRQSVGRDAKEHSWYGRANPYRLDHAFGTSAIVERMSHCEYSHTERQEGLSDHSMLSIDLN